MRTIFFDLLCSQFWQRHFRRVPKLWVIRAIYTSIRFLRRRIYTCFKTNHKMPVLLLLKQWFLIMYWNWSFTWKLYFNWWGNKKGKFHLFSERPFKMRISRGNNIGVIIVLCPRLLDRITKYQWETEAVYSVH